MADRERDRQHQQEITKFVYQRASTPKGFTISLNEHDALSMRVVGGEVTLFIKPQDAVQESPPDDSGLVAAEAEAEAGQSAAVERQDRRLRFTGRIASEPRYTPLPRRGIRVGFVVAEHQQDDSTLFHRTYATGDYARRIQQKDPHKGDEVGVDGERQINRIPQPDGSFRELPVVYCYGLRVRTTPRRNR